MTGAVARAHRLLVEAVDALADAAGASATEDDLRAVRVRGCDPAPGPDHRGRRCRAGPARHVPCARLSVRGGRALSDLLGRERGEARRRTMTAEHVLSRIRLDGTPLPPRLPATTAVFTDGRVGSRHVAVIAAVLDTGAARRLDPDTRSGAEDQLAERATRYTPSELRAWGTALVDALDQDGPEPDDIRPPQVNELRITRHRNRPGGRVSGRFDDAALFDAIASVVDAASPAACAARSPRGIADAHIRGATDRSRGARSTTSSRGRPAAAPSWGTWS